MTFPDEEPTRPDATGSSAAIMVFRFFDQLSPLDQKRFAKLVESWFTAGTDERILLEELAIRLARKRPP